MSLSDHVTLTISQDTVGIARAGFGVPLILSAYASFPERIRFYNSLADVAVDFSVTTSPEYLAAQAIFSQSPHPTRIAIGRSALKPTQVYRFTPLAIHSQAYKINVKGKGVTSTAVSITADSATTVAEITAALTTALNAVVGKNYLAADDTTHVTITGAAAGDWFSLELVDVAGVAIGKIEQLHADPGVATDLDAIRLENDEWYCLHTMYNSNAYVLAAAAWVNAQKKIYVFDVNESDAIKTAVTNSDTLDDIHTSAYSRVMGAYHPNPAAMFSAAWMGVVLPIEPGGVTWKYKTLVGPAAVTLTATHKTNLRARKANSYESIAGRSITWEGTAADGDFLDVMRDLDWLEDDMTKGVFGALAGADKIPYTDGGVAMIEAEVRASLRRAVARGILASDPEPAVTVPRVADVSSANKTARVLPDVKWSATLAGAIHKVNVTGVVSA